MIRRPPRSTLSSSSAASDVYKRQEKVRLMQANWIGRSDGLLVRFALDKKTAPKGQSEVEVYTTRPDTLFGAAFIALAPHRTAYRVASCKPRPRSGPWA